MKITYSTFMTAIASLALITGCGGDSSSSSTSQAGGTPTMSGGQHQGAVVRRPELQQPALARPLRVERLHQVVRHLLLDSLQAARCYRWFHRRAVYRPVVK